MNTIPNRREAEALLAWAGEHNPGGWIQHSRTVASAAERIAAKGDLDSEKAYILGLLHDIGRYEGVRGLHHTIAGYELMLEKGYMDCARICLTHSFPIRNLKAYSGKQDCSPEELTKIETLIQNIPYDEYDRLIQLCDAIAMPDGVALMDTRLMDVGMRHGFNECTQEKWRAFYAIKDSFDQQCGCSIYTLFKQDILNHIFK